MHVSICWNQACELPLCLPLLTWNLWSTSQLICFLKSCHRKCSAKQGMQEEIQRQTNRSVRWKKITSNANHNAVGWIHRQLVVIENWHLHIDKSHLSWQFETCCSKLLNCEHAGQQTVETARWPWYVNSSPHLLSHKESKPTYSMFKQQRFLQEMDENNRQCQDQRVRLLTAVRGVLEPCGGAHLWLSELSEARCKAVIVRVAVGLDGHIQDVNGLVQHTLKYSHAQALVAQPVDHISQESLCLRYASMVANWRNITSRPALHGYIT